MSPDPVRCPGCGTLVPSRCRVLEGRTVCSNCEDIPEPCATWEKGLAAAGLRVERLGTVTATHAAWGVRTSKVPAVLFWDEIEGFRVQSRPGKRWRTDARGTTLAAVLPTLRSI